MTNTDKCPSLKTSRGRVVSTKYMPRNPYRPAKAVKDDNVDVVQQMRAVTAQLEALGTDLTVAEKESAAIAQVITDALALDEAVAVPLNEVRCLWEGGSGQRMDRNCMCAECIALTARQNRNREAALKEQRTAKAVLIVLPDGTNGFQCSMCDQRVFASRPHSCFGNEVLEQLGGASTDQISVQIKEQRKRVTALKEAVVAAQGTVDEGEIRYKLRTEIKRLAAMHAAQSKNEVRAEREAQRLLELADRSRPPRWDPLGVAPMLWFLPEPGPAPTPRKRRSERVRDFVVVGFQGLLIALAQLFGLTGRVLAFPFVLLLRVLKAINRFMVRPWPAMAVSWLGISVGVLDVITGNYLAAGILFVVSTFFFVSVMFRQPKKKPAVEHRCCVRCNVRMEGARAICPTCKQEEVARVEHARLALPNKGEGWTFTKEGWVSPTPRCNCVPGTSKLCTTCRDHQDVESRTSAAKRELMSASLGPCSSCGDPAVGWMCMRCEAGFNTPKDKMHVSEYQARQLAAKEAPATRWMGAR